MNIRLTPVLLIALASPAMAQGIQQFQMQNGLGDFSNLLQRLVESPAAKQFAPTQNTIENKTILGPTGELLPPKLATKRLRGKDYFEWSLRWNKQQQLLATRRAVPATTVRGQLTRQSSFVQGFSNSGPFQRGGGRNFTSSNSTSDSREQLWRVGGHGGGPVEIYNPFISDKALDSVSRGDP